MSLILDGSEQRARQTRLFFFALLAVTTLCKLILAWQLPLFGDEAFYWLESRHPAPAHDDVPALTPWLIRFGSMLFGDSALALRAPFLLLALASLWLLLRSARAVGGEARHGWLAGSLALCIPLFAANGLLALPDVPLTFAVLVCVEGMRRMLDVDPRITRGGAYWLLAGLIIGWLSHYRFIVPLGAACVWLLVHPGGRELLRRRAFWLVGLSGNALGLAPLLWHQWQRAGSGFAFQFVDRHPWAFQPEALLDPLWQLLVTTPVLAVLLLWSLGTNLRSNKPAHSMIAGIAAMLLASYLLLAPFVDTERSRLHWPMPAFLLATLLAPGLWERGSALSRRWWHVGIGCALLALLAGVVHLTVLTWAPQRLAASHLYLHGFTGWKQASQLARSTLQDMPQDTLLVADNFMLAAQLSFALDGRQVHSLDHPLNRKHGRQGELRRLGLDQAAAVHAAASHPVLLVMEESASSLRQRPGWFQRLCEVFPGATPAFDVAVDHGRKRLIGYRQSPGHSGHCVPPPLGILNWPLPGDALSGELAINGWAMRDEVGIDALRVYLDGELLGELDSSVAQPGVALLFPASTDPRHPDVGFSGSFSPDAPPGRRWLTIEAQSADGYRALIIGTWIRWQPGEPTNEAR